MFKREKLKQQVSVLFLTLSFFSYTEEKPIYNDKDVKERINVKEGETFTTMESLKIMIHQEYKL